MFAVYKTINKINGKLYIGQHKNTNNMRTVSGMRYIGSGKILTQAIKKYGRENFDCVILEECKTKDEVDKAEIEWIEKLNPEYNIHIGGTGGDLFTNNPNKEQIRKNYSMAKKGVKHSKEHRRKIKESLQEYWKRADRSKYKKWGHSHIDETKKKIGEKSKQMWNSTGFKEKFSLRVSGKKQTKKQIEKKIKSTTRTFILTSPTGAVKEFYGRESICEYLKGKVWSEPLLKYGEYKQWKVVKVKK